MQTRLTLYKAVKSLIDYIEPNKGLNEDQIKETVDWLISDYKTLKLEEVLYCINDMKKNGRYFERLKYPEIKLRIDEYEKSETRSKMVLEHNLKMKPEAKNVDDARGINYVAHLQKLLAQRANIKKDAKVSLTQLEALKRFETNICEIHGVTIADVKSKIRKPVLIDVKQIIQHWQVFSLKWSHDRVAEYWAEDRSNVTTGIQQAVNKKLVPIDES